MVPVRDGGLGTSLVNSNSGPRLRSKGVRQMPLITRRARRLGVLVVLAPLSIGATAGLVRPPSAPLPSAGLAVQVAASAGADVIPRLPRWPTWAWDQSRSAPSSPTSARQR